MSHSFELAKDGKSFVFTMIGGDGSLNTDLQPLALEKNEYVTFQNVIPGRQRRAWRLRCTIPTVANDYSDIASSGTATTAHTCLYPGTLRGGNTRPYYTSDYGDGVYAQSFAGATATAVNTALTTTQFTPGQGAYISDQLIIGDASRGVVTATGGTLHTQYTGTATTPASGTSAVITALNPALSAGQQVAMVGSYFVCTSASATTEAAYRIASVDSGTQITLERVYVADAGGVGAGVNVTIKSAERFMATSGTTVTSSTDQYAALAYAFWFRLVLANLPTLSGSSLVRSHWIRWSGKSDDTEGTNPFLGVNAFDANGYLIMPPEGGAVKQMLQHGQAVLVFQERLLTVLHGEPEFDSAGSLDGSIRYPIMAAGYGCAASTPYGVFFRDAVQGLMVWTGSGPPRCVSRGRINDVFFTNSGLTYCSYFDGYVIITGGANNVGVVYNVESDEFATFNGGLVAQTTGPLFDGRGALTGGIGERIVASTGSSIEDYTYMFQFPTDTTTQSSYSAQSGGDASRTLSIATGPVGPPDVLLRPERLAVTYRTKDDSSGVGTPVLNVVVATGINNTSYSQRVVLAHTANEYVTRVIELDGIARAAQVSVSLTQTYQAYELDIAKVVVSGAAEGVGES